MALINITSIEIDNNPCMFLDQFKFHITFEALEDIAEEIDWELLYIGSAKDESKDQVLDQFSMGPLEKGVMQFTLESNPPDHSKINKDDLLNITAIILSVQYRKQEFFRVGYYTYNQYIDQELMENDPNDVVIDKVYNNFIKTQVQRSILAQKPRITRFQIDWKANPDKINSNTNLTPNFNSTINQQMFGQQSILQIQQDFDNSNNIGGHQNSINFINAQLNQNSQSFNHPMHNSLSNLQQSGVQSNPFQQNNIFS